MANRIGGPVAIRRLGIRLQEARYIADLSQVAVSERLGCATRSIERWEKGQVEPGVLTTAALAAIYGVTVDWLVDWKVGRRGRGAATRGPASR